MIEGATRIRHDAPAPAAPAAPEVAAQAALARATALLRGQAEAPWLARRWTAAEARVRSRVVGNWLVELDRLLAVLLDAIGEGAPSRATAARLADCPAAAWCVPHLVGLRRARAVFRYTGGEVTRGDARGGTSLTVGWTGADGGFRRFRVGQAVTFDRAALLEVCTIYDAVAAAVSHPRPARVAARQKAMS